MSIFFRVLLAVLMCFSMSAYAQDYPSKPIKIIVPYQPGATTDALARLVAQELAKKWGQPVVVENVPGASGGVGALAVTKAAPDGYTFLVTPGGVLTTNMFLYPKLIYDADALTPVSVIARTPLVVVVGGGSSINTLQEFIDAGKLPNSKLNYASQGIGNMAHLAPELMKSMSGMQMTHVPYKGSAPAIADLLGGHVDVMICTDLATALPFIRDGKLKAIGFCDEKRNNQLPSVPTVSEILPGFLASGWFGLAAPPHTPPAIVNKVSAAIADILKTSDAARNKILNLNVDAVGSTPGEMAANIAQERKRWGKVIRDNAITAN